MPIFNIGAANIGKCRYFIGWIFAYWNPRCPSLLAQTHGIKYLDYSFSLGKHSERSSRVIRHPNLSTPFYIGLWRSVVSSEARKLLTYYSRGKQIRCFTIVLYEDNNALYKSIFSSGPLHPKDWLKPSVHHLYANGLRRIAMRARTEGIAL